MSSTKVVPRGGAFKEIETRLDQESQERRNDTCVTPISALRRAEEFQQNLSMRFGTVEPSADAVMADAGDKGRKSTPLTERVRGQPQQQQDGEWNHNK